MDQQAANLLNNLKRPAVNSDSKINALNSLKSDIKHYRVPETALPTIFECLKLAITQQTSAHLAASAFSTLGHLIKRLSIQDASGNSIQQLVPRLLGVLQDRLGDLREPMRASASQALSDIYPYLGADVERIVREEALGGTHARQKETAMTWVVRMNKEQGMAFKSYVGPMVACLENADEHVRDTAKNSLVELFSSASDRAKADLNKQLKAHSVRHGIASHILNQIGAGSRPAPAPVHEPDVVMQASTRSLPTVDHIAAFNETINSEAAKPPPVETVPMDPIYVHTERELNDIFQDMLPHFDGKETEHNWMPRDKSVLKVRRLLKGNAPTEYHAAFMVGIKSLVDGVLKVANSLRTTMSTNGSQLIQELMKTLGPAMDSSTEILLQSFIKMSSATKHIAAENGKHTSDAIFQHCTYSARLMQHIWSAAQDKNASTRQCAVEWLKTILKRQSGYKQHFASSGGLDLTEKCIKKGLDDANPKVKEGTRAVYWMFAKVWTEKANVLIDKLDPKTRSMLEKDPNNPNAALHGSTSTASSAAPRPGGRSTLKELMAEQRRAKSAARNLPERPNSAMATLSPSKSKPELRSQSRGPSKLRSENRVASTASTVSTDTSTNSKGSSLMSGPVRRPRRPELARPQTADPYASKRLLRPETPANGAPSNDSPKGTGASKASVPTSSATRNRARTAAQPAGSREGSPNIPRRSPLPAPKHFTDSRPTSKGSNAPPAEDLTGSRDDDFTMVLPSGREHSGQDRRVAALATHRPALDKTTSVDSGLPHTAEEDDNFTMVLPSLSRSQREASPLNYRSPLKSMFDEAREKLDRPSSAHSRKQSDPFLEVTRKSPVSRRGSPVKSASPQPAEVQIYEDPVASDRAETPVNDERQVLSELPVNENVRVHSPTQSVGSHNSPAGSPVRRPSETRSPAPEQDRSEALRNRRLLTSGIERIRTRALDAHGFRRVQDLAKCQLDIWDNGAKYDELMSVLLDYLRSFPTDARLNQLPSSKSSGLKVQALSVLRALLALQRKYAGAWYANSLTAVISTRRTAESNVVSDIERTADEIVNNASPSACIEAVIEQLSSSTSNEETASARSVALSLSTIRALLVAARSHKVDLSIEMETALAHTSARYLEHADAEVRKTDVELACEVFARFGDDKSKFWSEYKGVDEGRLGLLTYYIARREKAN
ncbi:hypothetical protein Q7P37_000057 [Cladosporium fusiforme]